MATAKKKKAVKKAAKKTPVRHPERSEGTPKKTAKVFSSKIDWQKSIQPLQDRLVAIEIEVSNTTPSGLILPVENESLKRAQVVAAGTGRVTKKGKIRPLDVQVGDVILVTQHVGTKVTVQNQEAIIVREEDVLGIVSTPSL